MYQLAKELNDEPLQEEIMETYLINKFAKEEEKLKLRPTENNDEALKFLLRNHEGEEYQEFSMLIENYDYFRERIVKENYSAVIKGLSKLMFVEISLDRETIIHKKYLRV